MNRSKDILVVDDEVGIRELLSEILADEGYAVRCAENAQQARAMRSDCQPALVLLDIWMPDTDGVSLLREWAANGQLTMPVVMMSGHGTIETAVEATRIGAVDFLEKPVGLQKLLATVQRALKLGTGGERSEVDLSILGGSSSIGELARQVRQVLDARLALLLTGEPGAGYDWCARALHREGTPWIVLERDHHPRLASNPLGMLEEAREGVIFCRDVLGLSRVEQRGLAFLAAKAAKFELRLVCASAEPLAQAANEGRLDATLLPALLPGQVVVPPLRSRPEDLPGLIDRIWSRIPGSGAALPNEIKTALCASRWPGNLAQLEAVLANLALVGPSGWSTVQLQGLLGNQAAPMAQPTLKGEFFGLPLREARESFERLYFEHLLGREQQNMSRVAEKAGLERTHLYRKLKQLGIRFARRHEENHDPKA
ncbi:MAG: sigma-54-dependent Fis family transcriptional regulator [Betaproteobacteria bacterium]|nr:sigma-54-dependent Fis family transcriptional regulator [Betaproteobacteria bacterium]